MTPLTFTLRGIGLLGPGLASWAESRDILAGRRTLCAGPTALPMPLRLPSAERRRAGAAIKLALAVADQAVDQAGVDPRALATVFTASSGEGAICHALCDALARPDRLVSPTRFTNSVHNAAAGYWHISMANRAASTSLCALDGGFGAGLLEAATQVAVSGAPVLLVATDTPYPQPLHACRQLPDHFGLALVLAPSGTAGALAAVQLSFDDTTRGLPPTPAAGAALERLRASIPAAAGLTLLEAVARPARESRVLLDCPNGLRLCVDVLMELP